MSTFPKSSQLSLVGSSNSTKTGKSTALNHWGVFTQQWNASHPENKIPAWELIPADFWDESCLKAFGLYLAEDACKDKLKAIKPNTFDDDNDDEEQEANEIREAINPNTALMYFSGLVNSIVEKYDEETPFLADLKYRNRHNQDYTVVSYIRNAIYVQMNYLKMGSKKT